MVSKLILLAGLAQLAVALPQVSTTARPAYTTTLSGRPTTTSCPVLCIDYVNECGMGYGGCAPQCPGQPFPTYTKPPCPSKTTTARTTTTTCPVLCADYVNECGMPYGGCAPLCPGQPIPTYSKPPCPSKTTTKTTTTAKSTTKSTTKTTTTTKFTTTKFTSTTSACPTLCVDYINSCGGMWGTCFPRCPGTPMPTFTPPPCATRTTLNTVPTTRVTTDYVTYTRGDVEPTILTRSTYDYETLTRSSSTTVAANPRTTGNPYGQCGLVFGAEVVCPDNCFCFKYNDWYSQCIPSSSDKK